MKDYIPADLTKQIKEDYLAYSMSVLVGRAIPSLTDGMKPIQRRILTAMKMLNLKPDGRYMKSARCEGEVMGKYSPHGSSYGSIVNLAAPWNNNLPLVDGHGNFGSSTDNSAASRYTEVKLSSFAWDCMLTNEDTWQTTANYDGSLQEPIELDVKVPTLLLNGQEGIGVGFATRIPSHNLRDICDAVTKGTKLIPSFPTHCDIIRNDGLDSYIATGSGTLLLRSKLEIIENEKQGRKAARATLSFTCLPPTTNPEKIGQEIKNALDSGKLEGVAAVIDASSMQGDCLQVTCKPNVEPNRLATLLFACTSLETTYPARNLCIHSNKPVEYSSAKIISHWKEWRLDRLRVQFTHGLTVKETRIEIVEGLLQAISQIDKVIKSIRAASSKIEALAALMAKPFKFTRNQSEAILEMRLRQLTNLDATALLEEKETLSSDISWLKEHIESQSKREVYMLKEIKEIGVRYGEKTRSELIEAPEVPKMEKGSRASTAAAKPRFLKIDMKRGVATQEKGPRGALVLERNDKLITVTADGTLRKLPATYKGTLASAYSEVKLAKRESDVVERRYLTVFTLDNTLKVMVLEGKDLARATSKGKNILPEGATLVHFGEDSFTVAFKSSRKKPLTLNLDAKPGKPGGKGVKVSKLDEISF